MKVSAQLGLKALISRHFVATRTFMTRWRKRAENSGAVKDGQVARITVDMTVQTKAVAHPMDGHLMMRAIEALSDVPKSHRIVSILSACGVRRQTGGRTPNLWPWPPVSQSAFARYAHLS